MIQEQIKQLEERQLQIQKELAELKAKAKEEKPEFKVGDWVVNKSNPKRYICKITKIKNEDGDIRIYYYGNDYIDNVRHATHSEIENYLIEYYNKKGFVVRAKVIDKECKYFNEITGFRLITGNNGSDRAKDYFKEKGIHLAAECGAFSVPVDFLELPPSTPSIEINGIKLEFLPDVVKAGCREIPSEFFVTIFKEFKNLTGRTGIELAVIIFDYEAIQYKVRFDDLKSIASHYTK